MASDLSGSPRAMFTMGSLLRIEERVWVHLRIGIMRFMWVIGGREKDVMR